MTSPQAALKVAVIGAGLAGLTTAYRLHRQGFNVQVYEARPRVGGRILTATICGNIVELGGQNIADGGAATHLLRLAQELNLPIQTRIAVYDSYYFDGSALLPSSTLFKHRQFDPESLRLQLNALIPRSKNLHDVLKGLLQETDPLFQLLKTRVAGYEGAPLERLSPYYARTLYHLLLDGIASTSCDYEATTKILSILGGNGRLTEALANSLDGNIHLGQALTSIAKTTEGKYLLTFANHQHIIAEILVLTCPCPIYKDLIVTQDTIPQQILDAIRNIPGGTTAKIILPFPPSLGKTTALIDADNVAFFDPQRTHLTLYYVAQSSFFTQATLLNTYTQELPLLERGLPGLPLPSKPPKIAQDAPFLSYDSPIGYSWPNDPYAQGSYSYLAAGQEETLLALQHIDKEPVKKLFAPINRTLYFAGEHTSILLEAGGTMEAACESGERTARMIASAFNP